MEKAALSLNRAALSPRQDTDIVVAPSRQWTTITPKPPTCWLVARHSQRYPPPVPVATPQSPQDFTSRLAVVVVNGGSCSSRLDATCSMNAAIGNNHHDEWIIVRNVCVADPTLSSHEGRCRHAQRTVTCRLTRVGAAIWDHVGATRPPPLWLTAVAMVSVRVVSLSLWRKPTPSHKAVRRWA